MTIIITGTCGFETWQEKRAYTIGYIAGAGFKVEEITCDDCPSAKDGTCEWAWDVYNTDGDCLAVK